MRGQEPSCDKEDLDTNVFAPKELLVGKYFLELDKKAPTSASTAYHHLKWWQGHLGINMNLGSALVADFRRPQDGHRPQQRAPLELQDVNTIVAIACADGGARSTFAGYILLFTGACVRFRHLQRTILEDVDNEFVTGDCRKGKARRQGVRVGFRWTALRCWGPGRDVLAGVLRQVAILKAMPGYSTAPYLLPDLQLNGETINQTDKWLPRPMGPARFLTLLRRFFQQSLGKDYACAKEVGFNTLRRFLPTGADILDFDAGMSAGISNWQDGGSSKTGSKQRRPTLPMAKLYAHDRARSAGIHKRWIVCAVMRTIREAASSASSSSKPTSATWMAMRDSDFTWHDLNKEAASFVKMTPAPAPVAVASNFVYAASVKWAIQFRTTVEQRPWIHFFPPGEDIPYCRSAPFMRSPHREGQGFLEAAETEERICKKCFAYLQEHTDVAELDLFFKAENLENAKKYFGKFVSDMRTAP